MFFLVAEQNIPSAFDVQDQDIHQLQRRLGDRDVLEALLHNEIKPLASQWSQQVNVLLASPAPPEQLEDCALQHVDWWRNFFTMPRDELFIQKRLEAGANCAAKQIPLSAVHMLLSQTSLKMQQALFLGATRDEPSPALALFTRLCSIDMALLTRAYEKHQEEERKYAEKKKVHTRAHTSFLANMSHELRTPLNAIIGFTSILTKTSLTSSQHNYVQKIRMSSDSLLDLVNDILDFSKIEAGKLKLEAIPFTLHDVLDDLAELFSNQASQKALELLLMPAPDLPRKLLGDPFRLRQVLINLMGNALKFTDRGHVQLQVTLLEKTQKEARLHFIVKDTGVGISPTKLQHIFSSFTQADESMTRKYGGTGLGLSISKQLVELMDGTIGAESVIGQGTTFWFELPFGIAAASTTTTQTKIPIKLHRLKTLIVDDNELSLKHLYELCDTFGLDVTAMDDPEEALDALNTAAHEGQPYGLAILDWRMPKYDGLELAQIIRESPELAETPIILLTAFGMEDQRRRAEQLGIEFFLTKPIQRSVLYQTLKDIFTPNARPPSPSTTQLITRDKLRRQKARSSKILVAEDNPLNQEVIYSMLTGEKFQVELANDGLEVLAMLDESQYDLLLLDVQMPKLDGYKTATAIRNDERFRDLPIIAVTAHAMKGDKEKCLQAGMNDYLTKPLQFDHLIAVLHYWLSEGEASSDPFDDNDEIESITLSEKRAILPSPQSPSLPAPLQSGPIEPKFLGLVHFDAESAIKRMRGDQSLYRRLLRKLLAEHSQDHAKIRASIDGCCFSLAYEQVHKLKGIASNLSMTDVTRTIKALEIILAPLHHRQDDDQEPAPTIDLSSLLSALQRFELSYELALQELGELDKSNASAPSAPPDSPAVTTTSEHPDSTALSAFAAAHKATLLQMREASFLGDVDGVATAMARLPSDTPETQQCQHLLDEFDLEALHTLINSWLQTP